jgi:pimeloyl-ACP methyl ester carboxylesterase
MIGVFDLRSGPLAAVAGVLACLVVAAPAAAAGCSEDGWVGGQVDLCSGSLVYRDYVYDDFGADSGLFGMGVPGRFAIPAGDDRNPVGAEGSTDLVDLRLRIEGDRLHARFQLEAMYAPDGAIAALAIDTDANKATGGGPWKDVQIQSSGWEVQHSFKTGDPKTNVIEGSLPLPSGENWRIQAVVARPDGKVMNVAFRGTNERADGTILTTRTGPIGAYFEDVQAAILKSGDISETGHTVSVADMRNGATRVAPLEPGFHSRVYVSDYTTGRGEGWSETPMQGRSTEGAPYAQGFHYFGRYQPYGIYVPKQAGPHGLIVSMHSYSAMHTFLVNQPGFQRQLGEEINSVIVAPLARGPAGYYSDISERDVLDVMEDVQAAYSIDADRVISAGYSMGGYGAFRIGMLHPDKFAGVIAWVAGSGDASNTDVQSGTLLPAGAVGNVIDYTRSLLHVPTAMVFAAEDPLLHVHSAEAMRSRFSAGETPFEWFLHPAAEHTTFADLDEWGKEAAYVSKLRRVRNPVRVVFRGDEVLGNSFYKIAHDRAYWVSELRGRDRRHIDVDASAFGCGGTTDTMTTGRRAGETPVPWVSEFRDRSGVKPVAASPRFEAELRNVREMTVDAVATCLKGKTMTYKFKADGPMLLRFSDGRSISVDAPGTYEGTLAPGTNARPKPLRLRVQVRDLKKLLRSRVLRTGVRVITSCDRACALDASLLADKATTRARKLGNPVGKARARLYSRRRVLTVRLRRAAAAKLRRGAAPTLTLRVTARDQSGSVAVRTVRLRLRR